MCGICGVIHLDHSPVAASTIEAMNQTLVHRGPDGAGKHHAAHVALAMRRLSIIDVAGSDQPLYNEDHSIAVVFNGELFNFRDLRIHLNGRGHQFHTQGDGETIVHLYEEYGPDVPTHLRGQFAFALWDSRERRLILARDRMGQKPLYYYHDDEVFVFGSEIKALLRHPRVPRESAFDDPSLLAVYLGYGYVPAPKTAFKHIHALLPGHRLVLDDNGLDIQPYWSPPKTAPAQPDASIAPYREELLEILEEAVKLRLIADVPLGAFLSGGLDSSLIVALMQRDSSENVRTFSIGFAGDDSFDETPYAKEVAAYLGTTHTAFTVEPDALQLLPKLVWHHDQPFADSSAIPTFLVSELTRQHVTVALTGDGGDELFAGYERFYAAGLVQKLEAVPRPLWKAAAGVFSALPEGTGYYNSIKRAGRFVRGASQPLSHAYFDWVRLFDAEAIASLIHQSDYAGEDFASRFNNRVDLPAILYANMTTYLPDDLLIKADRSSMAASLEARAPFLDHVLVEAAAKVPFNLKLKGSTTKYMLKEMARGLLPDAIIDRKKHGFGVPLGAWLRKDSRIVRETLLNDAAKGRRLFDAAAVEALISEHESGKRDHGQRLWTLLTLEWWQRIFIDSGSVRRP